MVRIDESIGNEGDGIWKSVSNEDDRVYIRSPDAKRILARGLRHFIGDSAVWLDEYDQVTEWLEDNKGLGLFCAGNCGRGKSVICQKVLPVIFKYWHKKVVNTVTAVDLNRRFDEISQYKIISIDDIGTEAGAVVYGETHDYIQELVDLAERRQKLLIVTTNMNINEIGKKYGDRTVDRLRALTKCVIFEGKSLRGRKQ